MKTKMIIGQSASPFWNEYRHLVAQYYGALTEADGIPELDVLAAEQRLGFQLPQLLRDLYLVAGRREDIHQSHDCLFSPEALEVVDDAILFYTENQNVIHWGILISEMEQEDPTVFYAENMDPLVWKPFQMLLSQFLRIMLLWQGIMGGMAYSGVGMAQTRCIIANAVAWHEISGGETFGGKFLTQNDQILYTTDSNSLPKVEVYGASRIRESFLSLTEVFNISWNYSTLDEE